MTPKPTERGRPPLRLWRQPSETRFSMRQVSASVRFRLHRSGWRHNWHF